MAYGDSTRAIRAVDVPAVPGGPVMPLPVPAATFHLSADEEMPADVLGRSCDHHPGAIRATLHRHAQPSSKRGDRFVLVVEHLEHRQQVCDLKHVVHLG